MIEFVTGLSREAKSRLVGERIRASLDEGKRVYLIAPEQQALLWDARAARELPPSAATALETVSFTRLADSLFRRCGGCAKNYITPASKALVMYKALNAVREQLEVYGHGRGERCIPLLLSAASEAALYSVTPEVLDNAAAQLEGKATKRLAARLRDLALILAAYNTLLHESYDDPEEIPDAVCALADRTGCFSGCAVYIDSFYTLTPKEKNIVRRIMRDADSVLVTFAVAAEDRDGMHTEHIRECRSSLARMAAQEGKEVIVCDAGAGNMNPALEYLARNLFNHAASPYEGEAPIQLITASDRHDEAALAAARVLELVREGAEYSQIAVVTADAESLRGVCDAHFEAMGIPVYISKKSKLKNQGAVRLLLSAALVASRGWRREDVVACAKTGLCGLTPEQCDAMEKYADKWRIRGRRGFCGGEWSMNPDGYTDTLTEWGAQLLKTANEAREILVPPLEAFCNAVGGGATVEDACRAAYKLLCDFGVYTSIKSTCDARLAAGDGAAAQECGQVWRAVCEMLDTMVTVCGDAAGDAAAFYTLLSRSAEEAELGTIPDGVDRVVLAGAESARLDGVRHMIVLGAAEGSFPAVPGDNGFFTEQDKRALLPLGITLSPGMEARGGEELFRFYTAVTAPAETLTVIIPSQLDGRATRPSVGAARILKLFPSSERRMSAAEKKLFLIQNMRSLEYFLPTLDSEQRQALAQLYPQTEAGKITQVSEYISAAAVQSVFGEEMKLTQSRLECFGDCPQSYYCRYILHLDDDSEVCFEASDVGNFVHKVLEQFLYGAARDGLDFPIDAAESEQRARRLVAEYTEKVLPPDAGRRQEYLLARVSRSLLLYIRSLGDEFAQSDFRPAGFEVPVGFDATVEPMKIPLPDGGEMQLRGIIDRLDVCRLGSRVYVRVADYKTGAKNFNLKEVMSGRGVQLLLYLFTVCGAGECELRKRLAPDGEELVPAGALYFSARPGDAASDIPLSASEGEAAALAQIKRSGIVLGDEAVVRAMEHDGEGRYIPVSLNSDGTVKKNSFAVSEDDMEKIRIAMCEALSRVGEDIKSGRASADPQPHVGRSPCEYCKMKPVCRYDGGGRGNE